MADRNATRVRELFDDLVDQPADVRAAKLDELQQESPSIAERLRRLLGAHDRATSFGSILQTDGRPSNPPETIGPYRLLERLGEGGMGVVYLAEQRKPVNRRVAIKIIRPGMASKEVIQRFEAERQALALMSHPGIARILDGGETESGLPYFVMEHVSGLPLLRYCNEKKLDIRARLQLMHKVCQAVQHAHQKGVIHRDLKPSNILVSEEHGEPHPKIIDFGVAKAIAQPLTSAALHTRFGSMVGTPDYMSPEQCSSGNIDIDTRSDVYSLGAILYELLSGQLPYNFEQRKLGEADILLALRNEHPQTLSRRARDTSEAAARDRRFEEGRFLARALRGELDWIVGKAISPIRQYRYDSALALADDIDRYLHDVPVLAAPPSLAYRSRKFVARHTLGVSLAGISLTLLAIFSVLMTLQVAETRAERNRAIAEARSSAAAIEFLLHSFRVPQEFGEIGGNLPIRTVLDRNREALLEETELTLDARLRINMALADAYQALGLHEDAAKVLEEAVQFLNAIGEPIPTRIKVDLADVARLSHDTQRARSLLVEVLEETEGGKNDKSIRETALLLLAMVEMDMGRLDEARRLLSLADPDAERLTSSSSLDSIFGRIQLYSISGELDKARALATEMQAWFESRRGRNSLPSIQLLSSIAGIDWAEGRDSAANERYRDIHARLLATLGGNNELVDRAELNIAATTTDAHESNLLLEKLLVRGRETHGAGSPQLVELLATAAATGARHNGCENRYLEMVDEALAITARHFGEGHASAAFVHFQKARVLALCGESDSAMAELMMTEPVPLLKHRAIHDVDLVSLRERDDFAQWATTRKQ
ncbi:MAG: protein kinase [Gammaproteobacteria bacterium]|nr:protein kinase [Gammaproteobacteria bacterium]